MLQNNIKLRKNKKGEFYFRKKSDNDKYISGSTESYKSKQMALKGLAADTRITPKAIHQLDLLPLNINYLDETVKKPCVKGLIVKELAR